jgi:zinc transporter, ZIP family
MPDITSSAVALAFGVTLLAGLFTALGSVLVFRASRDNAKLLAFGLAFAAGAMVYVSLVEIFGKSVDSFTETYGESRGYLAATLAFFCGIGLVLLLDRLIPNPHGELETPAEGIINQRKIARVGMLAALAITAHNFPEGLATFFLTLNDPAVGAPLAFAIAIHNIPEGVSIAIPVYFATGSKTKATLAATLSGLAEPVGAVVGYLILAPYLSPFVYGAVFGVVAGVMVFLALDELLPTARRYATNHHQTLYGMVLGMGLIAVSLVLFK